MNFLQKTFYNGVKGEKPVRAGNEPGELGQTRRKLIDFLQTSDFYEPERLLAHFSDNSKWAAYRVMSFLLSTDLKYIV